MKVIKEIIYAVNRTITTFCFGMSLTQLFIGKYEHASWTLFGVSILFMIGYFLEKWSE